MPWNAAVLRNSTGSDLAQQPTAGFIIWGEDKTIRKNLLAGSRGANPNSGRGVFKSGGVRANYFTEKGNRRLEPASPTSPQGFGAALGRESLP